MTSTAPEPAPGRPGAALTVAIFSDVHGNLAALLAVLAAIDRLGPVQLTVAAGDLVAPGGARPAETLDLLVARGCLLPPGNHDERLWLDKPYRRPSRFNALARRQTTWAAAQLGPRRVDLIRRLPQQVRLSPAPGQDLLIVHANVRDPLEGDAMVLDTTDTELAARFGGAAARVIAFGHHHRAAVRAWEEALLVNVAAVSMPEDGRPLAGFTLLGWDGGAWSVRQYRVPYDAGDEARALAGSGIPLG